MRIKRKIIFIIALIFTLTGMFFLPCAEVFAEEQKAIVEITGQLIAGKGGCYIETALGEDKSLIYLGKIVLNTSCEQKIYPHMYKEIIARGTISCSKCTEGSCRLVETTDKRFCMLKDALIVPLLPKYKKGYELYSFKINGRWHFNLLPGTNRDKTYEEVIAGRFKPETYVVGVKDFKFLLRALPEDIEVFWVDEEWLNLSYTLKSRLRENNKILAYPPDEIFNDIVEYATRLGLKFVYNSNKWMK